MAAGNCCSNEAYTNISHRQLVSCTQVHLEAILPAVLGGLADEAEGVRSAALAAGRTLVDLYTGSALELLLPAILDGTGNGNWRIRQSSVELLGDLLFKVYDPASTIINNRSRHVFCCSCCLPAFHLPGHSPGAESARHFPVQGSRGNPRHILLGAITSIAQRQLDRRHTFARILTPAVLSCMAGGVHKRSGAPGRRAAQNPWALEP